MSILSQYRECGGIISAHLLASRSISLNTSSMTQENDKTSLLADFCSARAVLLVAVSMVLLAIVMLLVPGQRLTTSWESLGMLAMFLQWLGLMSLALLCLLSPWLKRLSLTLNTGVTFVIIQLTTLFVSEVSYRLTQWQSMLHHLQPDQHDLFLLRNVAISIIISGVVLRYMYLQRQLQVRTLAESQARIQALQARIRPHFLFNSMNTIAALTHIDADAAEQAVMNLSEIYRATLQSDDALTTLDNEIDLTRHYLAVEQLRLGERLKIDWQIDDDVLQSGIPSLTIQPLVENAVYHGIEPRDAGGTIEVHVRARKCIEITIRNPLPSRDDITQQRGNQMALNNIRERLAIAYGKQSSLRSTQDETHYEVVLCLPKEIA